MTNDIQSVFADGHDRLQWDVQESNFQAVKVDPKEMAVTAPKATPPVAQRQAVEPVLSTANAPNETFEPATPLVDVHDRRNQLTSLVQNARRNEEAIKARNERIKQTKQQSRNRYGW